jgi:hypothetical protein
MYPVRFKEAYEQTLGAGENPNCGDLPYVVAKDPATPGPVVLVSCWEPSEEELAEIIRTKKVFIGVMANPTYRTQPPVYVMGVDPFTGLRDGANFIPVGRTPAEDQVNEIIKDALESIRDAQPE